MNTSTQIILQPTQYKNKELFSKQRKQWQQDEHFSNTENFTVNKRQKTQLFSNGDSNDNIMNTSNTDNFTIDTHKTPALFKHCPLPPPPSTFPLLSPAPSHHTHSQKMHTHKHHAAQPLEVTCLDKQMICGPCNTNRLKTLQYMCI